jgi:hypothetical protein
MDEFVGFWNIGNFQIGAVPLNAVLVQLLFELSPQGDVAKQNDLGERPGKLEIGTGCLAAFAGIDPFLIVPR